MTVSCPECRSVFRVDPAKVPATGVRARCSVCGGVIAIAGGTLPVSVTPIGAPAFPGGVSRATPVAASSLPPAARPTPAAAGVRMPTPVRTPTPVRMPTPVRSATPAAAPVVFPTAGRTATPAATPAVSGGASSSAGMPTPVSSAVSGASSVAMATPAVASMATASPAAPAAPTPSAPRAPINPFLRADPSQRARRLARALVSDLVAYHPQKREEGLRDGTLRQLFREDIKKSYEEYVEQVGREIAESAPHFQDALNEILAGGRRLF